MGVRSTYLKYSGSGELFFVKKRNQIIEPIYREPPHAVAEHHHVTHNIELPKFRRTTLDLDNPLHLWLTALCRAQDQNKTLRDVVDMDLELQTF